MPKPARNPKYLAWIHEQRCWACKRYPVEAAHVGLSISRRGLGQKYPDDEAIPLCAECHRGNGSIHAVGPEKFFAVFDDDRDRVIRKYRTEYERKEGLIIRQPSKSAIGSA